MHLNWLAKFGLMGPGPLVVNIIVNYCCTRVLLYAKMLKETETEETRIFCHLSIISDISIGGCSWAPLATPMLVGMLRIHLAVFESKRHLLYNDVIGALIMMTQAIMIEVWSIEKPKY